MNQSASMRRRSSPPTKSSPLNRTMNRAIASLPPCRTPFTLSSSGVANVEPETPIFEKEREKAAKLLFGSFGQGIDAINVLYASSFAPDII